MWEFTWRVSDCEELLGLPDRRDVDPWRSIHAQIHLTTLCINGRGQCAPPHHSDLLHLDQAEACLQRVTERTFYGISPLSGLPLRKILSGLPVF